MNAKKIINPYIGQRIRLCRKNRNLSQESLASLLSISPNYLGELERGQKSLTLHIADRITDLFHISYDFLLRGIDPSASPILNLSEKDPKDEFTLLLHQCTDDELRFLLCLAEAALRFYRAAIRAKTESNSH